MRFSLAVLTQIGASLLGSSLLAPSALAGDRAVPQKQLMQMIAGRTVAIGPNTASYGADGTYSYSSGDRGLYRVSNGRICIDFENGHARCDTVVSDGGRYYLINGRGDRYTFTPQ